MAKFHLVGFLGVLISLTVASKATVYMVGDSSGWDISTDLDSWENGKKFVVGDILLFQYSSSTYSVCELTKEDYDKCNTSNPLLKSTTGNTSIPLTRPGDWYFTTANQLFCESGMKIQVFVQSNSTNTAPIGAPQSAPTPTGSIPGTSKNNNNPSLPSSAEIVQVFHPFLLFLLGFVLGYLILGGIV